MPEFVLGLPACVPGAEGGSHSCAHNSRSPKTPANQQVYTVGRPLIHPYTHPCVHAYMHAYGVLRVMMITTGRARCAAQWCHIVDQDLCCCKLVCVHRLVPPLSLSTPINIYLNTLQRVARGIASLSASLQRSVCVCVCILATAWGLFFSSCQ